MDSLRARSESLLASALVIVALGLFALQGASLFAPIVHEQHNWRQADVYSVAYSFHEDGFDFLHPRIDFWRGPTGIVGMEAPVYPTLVHIAMYFIGDQPRTARVVSGLIYWLSMLLAAVTLSPKRAELAVKRSRGICFMAAAALSPMGIGEFRQIQADGVAISLTLAAASLCILYSRTGRARWLASAIGLYSLAAITKSPVLVAGPCLWMLSFCDDPLRARRMAVRALPFLVPIAAYFVWFRWAQELTTTYETLNPYFNLNFEPKEIAGNLKNFGLYPHVFGFLIGTYAINWVLFPAFVAGIVLAFRPDDRRVGVPMFAWLFFGAFFTMAFAFRTTVHWYYAMVVFPPAVYFTGLGLANVLELGRKPGATAQLERAMAFFVVLALFGTFIAGGGALDGKAAPSADGPAFDHTWYHARGWLWLAGSLIIAVPAALFAKPGWVERRRLIFHALALAAGIASFPRAVHDVVEAFDYRSNYEEWFTFDDKYSEIRYAVNKYTTRADLFLVDGYQPFYLHLTRRKGFASDPGTAAGAGGLNYYLQRGMKYYLHHAENPAIEEARRDKTPIARGKNFELYCIAKDGCAK